ncbi:MerR family transcriptional regulator [Sporosarcina sp. Te-1]|uniref:MerR family transcriptional regulator n=1 Tax=Sporosarcina sp. Te-1 TaxID=2818390 RepID=UPI001A9D3594|nr:MerR family transcriptional regulator [Sporosarcina sp. Te-1]QTD40083.1 MerR family transcriptional regulator [Sporosarcina sp. Te-1]
METVLYTIGEFAKKSGVSVRTLRYYDSIHLLQPSNFTEGGHRLYDTDDLHRLQQIQALKFLRFPLKEIKEMVEQKQIARDVMVGSIEYQQRSFEAQLNEIQEILANLDYLKKMVEEEPTVDVSVFSSMLHMLILANETDEWLSKHLPSETFDELDKGEKLDLDKEWTKVLTAIKTAVQEEISPDSEEAQQIATRLTSIMGKTMQGKAETVSSQIKQAEPLDFPNPFTEKEQQFLESIMNLYEKG